jgi:hypothetical protein
MFAAHRALRPHIGSAVVACLALFAVVPALAQTSTPGTSVPALVTPHTAVPPFDMLAVPPGGLPRAPTRAIPNAPEIPPSGQVRDGKQSVTFVARFSENGPEITSGIQWRVFHDEADANGNLPLAADSKEARPTFRLNPGTYVWHATWGLSTRSHYFEVRQEDATQNVVIRAGALRFRGIVSDAPIDADQLRFKLTATEGGVERAIHHDIRAGTVLRLDAGTYHVVSSYGDANAVIEVDVRVQPGRLIDATVHHKAAAVHLKLVRQPNGAPLTNTSWSVLTPGGDVVRESIGAFPNLVLAEGSYTVIARNDGQSFSRDFEVKAGENVDLELLRP